MPEDIQPATWQVSWLRLAYCAIFLLALLTVFTVWSEVGGQGHLDLMPWYTKLICVMATSWCFVRFTAGMIEQRQAWNRRTLGWFAGIIALCFVMGAITYYYHLHEEPGQSDTDDSTTSAMNCPARQTSFTLTSERTQG